MIQPKSKTYRRTAFPLQSPSARILAFTQRQQFLHFPASEKRAAIYPLPKSVIRHIRKEALYARNEVTFYDINHLEKDLVTNMHDDTSA